MPDKDLKIEHVFNEIGRDKDKEVKTSFIESQKLETFYIKNFLKEANDNEKKKFLLDEEDKVYKFANDYEEKYYSSLLATEHFEKNEKDKLEERKFISKYDDKKINALLEKLTNNSLEEDILLINGDFWGIQKFIFDGLQSKQASKILRSRSALVQLMTYVVVSMIKEKFPASQEVLFGAGKFLMLAKYEDNYEKKIEEIQDNLDKYFLKNYFGQNGIILNVKKCKAKYLKGEIKEEDEDKAEKAKEKKLNGEKMKEVLEALAKDSEVKKFNKFKIHKLDDKFLNINIFEDLEKNNDNEICPFCSKRPANNKIQIIDKDETVCEICANQILLGTYLTKFDFLSFSKEKDENYVKIFNDFYVNFYKKIIIDEELILEQDDEITKLSSLDKKTIEEKEFFDISAKFYRGVPKWSLGSYVPKKKNNMIKSFEELAEGSQGLMALKADVDKLGDTFRTYYMESFKKFNRLSRELDFFFSDYVTEKIKNEFPNCYIIFAGGDDLFLIGEYKEVVRLAVVIRNDFYKFALEKATISIGLTMFKPSTPITYVSKRADAAESKAKGALYTKNDFKDSQDYKKYEQKENKDRDGICLFDIAMKFETFINIEKDSREIFKEIDKNLDGKSSTFYYRLLDFCDMSQKLIDFENSESKDDIFDPRNALWKSQLNYLIKRNFKDEFESYAKLSDLVKNYGEKFKPLIYLKIYNDRDKQFKEGEK